MPQPGREQRDQRAKTRVLRLSFLPDNFTIRDVLHIFEGVGKIVTVMHNKFDQRFCFIEFSTPEEATRGFSHIRSHPIIHPVSRRPARVDFSVIGSINVTEKDMNDAGKSDFYTTHETSFATRSGGPPRVGFSSRTAGIASITRDHPPRDYDAARGYDDPRSAPGRYTGYDGYDGYDNYDAPAFGGRPAPVDAGYGAPAPAGPPRQLPYAPPTPAQLDFVQNPHAAPSPVILLTITSLVHAVTFETL